MIKITTPATSANLGVGYDCLGLAINLYAEFSFSKSEHHLSITGCPEKFQNEDNIVYKAFIVGCQALNKPIPNLHIDIQTKVPVSRGLGSSATCIVSGIKAAGEWYRTPFSKERLLTLANQVEGHPDNVTPAIYGGLCMTTYTQGHHLQVVQYPVNPKWQLLAIIPDTPVSTNKARSVLPTTMNYTEATYQISHALMMVTGMQNGNEELIKEGFIDKMQQPYRAKLIQGFTELKQIFNTYDVPYYVSGSGSTVMAVLSSSEKRDKIKNVIQNHFPQWQTLNVAVDVKGTQGEM